MGHLSLVQQLCALTLLSLALTLTGQLSHARRLVALAVVASTLLAASAALVIAQGILLPVFPLAGVIAAHYVMGLETVRRRFGLRIAAQESSLSALVAVGQATASRGVDTDRDPNAGRRRGDAGQVANLPAGPRRSSGRRSPE